MPLLQSKSKKAFLHNLKAEIKAGKPMKQGLAIAYNIKRRNKMADGGEVKELDMPKSINDFIAKRRQPPMDEHKNYAKGGMVPYRTITNGFDPKEIANHIRAKNFPEPVGVSGDDDMDDADMDDLEASDNFLTAGAPPEPRYAEVSDTDEDYERSHEVTGDMKMNRRKMLDEIMYRRSG